MEAPPKTGPREVDCRYDPEIFAAFQRRRRAALATGRRDYVFTDAEVFAVELLLPEKLVRKKCEVSPVDLRPVKKLAEAFETSVTATAIRFIDFSPEECALVYSEKGCIKWSRKSETCWWRVLRWGAELEPASLASDFFRKGSMSEDPEEVRGDAWIESESGRCPDIVEHSMPIPSLDAVVTMLWRPS